MTTPRPVKGTKLVGVIASPADFRFALRMQHAPDLFELRLDYLGDILAQLERKMSILPAPIIITARDPREGGIGNLSLSERRELLSRFLPHAKYVDVELRSARAFEPLLAEARKRHVGVILSFHDFRSTPPSRSLRAKAARAKKHEADIFKVATRTEKLADLARLADFIASPSLALPISAMGIGKLGAVSRLLLARAGSALNYGSLREANVEGQLPLDVLRSASNAQARHRS
ncbi:MAG TPA: type I 3-dehydroquinate dehydratase [Chthoniobacterales bacterium]|jgi:3-dehydroquinate dehydratase-1|nr:type I 3-dehydroquinate dehydratase [Chthoniobacterales bacterium]